MQTWRNGEKSQVVKKIIDQNFNIVSRHLPHNVLSLSKVERELLGSDYLSEGLRVFDTTEEQWYKYEKNKWVKSPLKSVVYTQTFSTTDWKDNKISIDFSTHLVTNPIVQVFINDGNSFSPIIGGVEVDENFNIILDTDLAFDGKVVVK